MGERPTPESQSAVKDTTVPAEETAPAQPIEVPIPLLELEPKVDLPLAASLPLQEAIQPETIKSDLVSEQHLNTSTIIESTADGNTQQEKDRDYQTVLEEIAQLGEGSHETTIANLTRYVNHANPMVRATAALTLGELAANNQGQSQEDIITLLNELLQDSNSEVRLQAAAALGKI